MNKIKLIPLLLSVALITCTNETEFEYPLIQTGLVTNIDSTGATFHASIIDLGKSDILEHGFTWSRNTNSDFGNSERFIVSGPPSGNTISKRISSTLEEDGVYNVRAFIRSRDFFSYGKEVSFKSSGSLAPVITDFFPKTGNLNDTLVIIGNNFSYLLRNYKIYFTQFSVAAIKANPDSLFVIVPSYLYRVETYIKVSAFGHQVILSEPFKLKIPVINDFHPKSGTSGSIIEITGSNFNTDKNKLLVKFDRFTAEILSNSETLIRVRVPMAMDVNVCKITVRMNNYIATSSETFKLELPTTHNFEP